MTTLWKSWQKKIILHSRVRKKGTERSFRKFFIDELFSSNKAIRPGTREEAISFIRSWLHDQLEEFLIIADPYLEKEDLDILKIVNEIKKSTTVSILGSKNGPSLHLEEEFRDYWKKISEEDPPFTNVFFCWMPEAGNATPFHDRWLITKNSGLRLGTSLNSIGLNKESELSVMASNDALVIKEETLSEYIQMRKRNLNGMRIQYKSFSI